MAMNDEMALGALEALRTRGKLKQVKLVGFNGAFEAIQQVYRGNMAADVVQYPERIGELFVHWAVRIANGEKPPQDSAEDTDQPPNHSYRFRGGHCGCASYANQGWPGI